MKLKDELSDYHELILRFAEQKLLKDGKPYLSESLLISGIVSLLKKIDKKDKRHTDKIRFKRNFFNELTQHYLWKEKIIKLANGKYILSNEHKNTSNMLNTNCYKWSNINYYEAVDSTLQILKEMDPYEFEDLLSKVLLFSYKNYSFSVSKKSGDGGIDIVGTREDIKNPDKLEVVFIQAKKFDKKEKVDISDAYEFLSTSRIKLKNEYPNKVSKFEGLFITTACYGYSFEKVLIDG